MPNCVYYGSDFWFVVCEAFGGWATSTSVSAGIACRCSALNKQTKSDAQNIGVIDTRIEQIRLSSLSSQFVAFSVEPIVRLISEISSKWMGNAKL